MTSAEDPSGLEDDETDFITIHFLSQQEPETIVRVKQRGDKSRRQEKENLRQQRGKKDELLLAGATPHSSMTSLSRSYSRLPDAPSGSWLSLKRLNAALLSSSESVAAASDQPQQQQQQQDFLSTLFDKLSGSLTVVSETPEDLSQEQQERDQALLTYTVYRVSTRRFKDSPPPPEASSPTDPSSRRRCRRRCRRPRQSGQQDADCNSGAADDGPSAAGESEYSECDEFDATDDEDKLVSGAASGAEGEKAETPEIVRFLWAHQAKCWPPPLVANGAGDASDGGGGGGIAQFGHPIFNRPSPQKQPQAASDSQKVQSAAALREGAGFAENDVEIETKAAIGDTDDPMASIPAEEDELDLLSMAGTGTGAGGGAIASLSVPSVLAPTPVPPSLLGASSIGCMSPSPTYDDGVSSAVAGGCGSGLGEVKLALDFNFKSSVLLVHIIECRGLPIGDAKRGRTDCYVKTCMLPDQTHKAKRRTKVKKNTQAPIFDEILKYSITASDLETRKLHVSAWHSTDLLQSDVLLGELELPMSMTLLQCKDAQWHCLHRSAPSMELQLAHSKYVGEVTLSLKYVTADNVNITDISQVVSNGELRIWVKEARHLPSTRMGSQAADPYVKLCLLPDRSSKGKRKTPPVQKSCSPVWNLVLKFENMSVRELHSRALELTIWDSYGLMPGKKVFLGGILLHSDRSNSAAAPAATPMDRRSPSPKSPARLADEVRMWRTVLERHNVWVDGNLRLRPAMPKQHLQTD